MVAILYFHLLQARVADLEVVLKGEMAGQAAVQALTLQALALAFVAQAYLGKAITEVLQGLDLVLYSPAAAAGQAPPEATEPPPASELEARAFLLQ
jgi:hypothetical protein